MENGKNTDTKKRSWLEWLAMVLGWLFCAGCCLALTIALEPYAQAYDTFLPAVILLLFCNIFVFLFVGSRWAAQPARLYGSVARICLGELLLLAGMFAVGRYAM